MVLVVLPAPQPCVPGVGEQGARATVPLTTDLGPHPQSRVLPALPHATGGPVFTGTTTKMGSVYAMNTARTSFNACPALSSTKLSFAPAVSGAARGREAHRQTNGTVYRSDRTAGMGSRGRRAVACVEWHCGCRRRTVHETHRCCCCPLRPLPPLSAPSRRAPSPHAHHQVAAVTVRFSYSIRLEPEDFATAVLDGFESPDQAAGIWGSQQVSSTPSGTCTDAGAVPDSR